MQNIIIYPKSFMPKSSISALLFLLGFAFAIAQNAVLEGLGNRRLPSYPLLSEHEISSARAQMRNQRTSVLPKKLSQLPYTIVAGYQDDLLAVFPKREGKLGNGKYSSVKLAKNLRTGEIVALKKTKFDPKLEKDNMSPKNEAKILEAMGRSKSPFSLYENPETKKSAAYHAQTFLDGHNLEKQVNAFKTAGELKQFEDQLLSMAKELHESGFTHRDMHAGNIIQLNNPGDIKDGPGVFRRDGKTYVLVDFGRGSISDPLFTKYDEYNIIYDVLHRRAQNILGSKDPLTIHYKRLNKYYFDQANSAAKSSGVGPISPEKMPKALTFSSSDHQVLTPSIPNTGSGNVGGSPTLVNQQPQTISSRSNGGFGDSALIIASGALLSGGAVALSLSPGNDSSSSSA